MEGGHAMIGPGAAAARRRSVDPNGGCARPLAGLEIEGVVSHHDRIGGFGSPVSKEHVDARRAGLGLSLVPSDHHVGIEEPIQAGHFQGADGVFVRVAGQYTEGVGGLKRGEQCEGIWCGLGLFDERPFPVIHLFQEGL